MRRLVFEIQLIVQAIRGPKSWGRPHSTLSSLGTSLNVIVKQGKKNKLRTFVTQDEPHLPYEFTHLGMLERVSAYVENQVRITIIY